MAKLSPGIQVSEVEYRSFVSNLDVVSIGIVGKGGENAVSEVVRLNNAEELVNTFGPDIDDIGYKSAKLILSRGVPVYYKAINPGGSESSDADYLNEKGLDAFSNADTLNISVLMVPGVSTNDVIQAGIKVAESRGECIFLADPPSGLTPRQVVDWSNAKGTYTDNSQINSDYAAIYYPWVKVAESESTVVYPPSVFVAICTALAEDSGESWKAIAGVERGLISNVAGLEYQLTQTECDNIYGGYNVINPIINNSSIGIVIWGNKTTHRNITGVSGAPIGSVNVRRVLNYVKKTTKATSLYLLFAPNDSYTWSQFKNMIDPVLRGIKAERGIDEYKVLLDSTTTTEEDKDNQVMKAIIYIKPVRAVEFIEVDFIVTPYTVSLFEE